MQVNRRAITIVLVLSVSMLAVPSAIAMTAFSSVLLTEKIISTAPSPKVSSNEIYLYLPVITKNHPLSGSWEEVGPGSATGGGISNLPGSNNPSISVAPDGTPYVAWNAFIPTTTNSEIYVRRWNGSSWEEVGPGSASGGGISNTGLNSFDPSIAIAPDGTPYVAWWDGPFLFHEIFIRRWNGSIWEEVGPGSASGGGISDNLGISQVPSIAIAPNGTPYVAWQDSNDGDWEIYVRRWNGSSWEEVGAGSASGGGISNNPGTSQLPSIAIAPNGTPYVAWHDGSLGNYQIYVRRWNGSSWEEVGAGSASGGGISNTSESSWRPSIAIAPDGTPYIAWDVLLEPNSQIYVRRWNGVNWEEVGPGSASGGGISSVGPSGSPSIAVAPSGTPYITWADGSSGDSEIYVLYWNGGNWLEVGSGSASGGGISNTSASYSGPSIAVAPNGTPYIAWPDGNVDEYEIYVRRWIESN